MFRFPSAGTQSRLSDDDPGLQDWRLIFGAGLPKSGTHSIEGLFKANFRAGHEPKRARVIEIILAYESGLISGSTRRALFLHLLRKMKHDVIASHHMVHFIDLIRDELSNAKVVLTIRNCHAWLDSILNHELNRISGLRLSSLRDFRYGGDRFVHAPQEAVLKECGLYTLDGYLSYWKWHIETIIRAMPGERLLIMRTEDIQRNLQALAVFAGVSIDELSEDRSHEYSARRKHDILSQIDPGFIEDKIAEHAGDLMSRYYPELTGANAAGPLQDR